MFPGLSQFLTNSWDLKTVCWVNVWKNQSTSLQCCTAQQISRVERPQASTWRAQLSLKLLRNPGHARMYCEVVTFSRGEDPNTVSNPGLGWKTRLKLLISRWRIKGQGKGAGSRVDWAASGGEQLRHQPLQAEHQLLLPEDVPPNLGSCTLPLWHSS